MAPPRLRVTAVRYATEADLDRVRGVEAAADELFETVMDIGSWPEPPLGRDRARRGVLLAVGDPLVGFAHLADLGTSGSVHWHLEQLAVHPDLGRRGIGTMLLRAAQGHVLDSGGSSLTLTTFADVAWNGPWYAARGFREVNTATERTTWAALAPVRARELNLGLERGGRRIAMVADIADEPTPRRAVSVIPVRRGDRGTEVFVQHRQPTMDFAPGAVVFPGGRVDPGDEAAGARLTLPTQVLVTHRRRWRATAWRTDQAIRTMLATALREVAEETGAHLAPDRLLPWDCWVTPIGGRHRFEVAFLLVAAHEQDGFAHRTPEARHSEWVAVADLVRRVEAGALAMVPPTRALVDELSALGSVASIVSHGPRITTVTHDVAAPRPRRHDADRPGVQTPSAAP